MLLAFTVGAADVGGRWNATIRVSDQDGTATLVLRQVGEKLTGVYSTETGEAALNGTIKDGRVIFDCNLGGVPVHFDGTVSESGDEMEGTLDFAGQESGTLKATKG